MSIRTVFSRRFLASAVTIPVLAGGLVLVTPGVAEAVTCGQSWSNKDTATGQGITIPSQGQYTIPMHNGIYSDCTIKSYVSTGIKLRYDCYRVNSYGNTWTHLNLDGYPDVNGWVWDHYLNDGGSLVRC